jgi:hypothetical protein
LCASVFAAKERRTMKNVRQLTEDAGYASARGSVVSSVFARALADEIASAIIDARKSAGDYASEFDLDSILDRVCTLTAALDYARSVHDRSLARNLAGSITNELHATRTAYDSLARGRIDDPSRTFDITFVTHLDRARARAQALDGHFAYTWDRHVADSRNRAAKSASEIIGARTSTTHARGLRRAKRTVSCAAKMLAVAALMLPAEYRAQYGEEYLSELWDLAQSGDGRLRQLRYALRQLLCAIPMSRALRPPSYRRTSW